MAQGGIPDFWFDRLFLNDKALGLDSCERCVRLMMKDIESSRATY